MISDRLTTIRAKVNTGASGKGGLGGLLGFWYTFLQMVVDWDLLAILSPDHLQSFVTGSIAAFLGVGTIAGWNRDQPSARQEMDPTVADPELPTIGTLPELPDPVVYKPIVAKNWFSDAEMECKGKACKCTFAGMDPVVMKMANDLREKFGPIIVNSGYRCPEHNSDVGGSTDSYHMKASAIDLRAVKATPLEMYQYLTGKYVGRFGIGLYKSFVHIDSRTDSWARKSGPNDQWQSFELDIIGL